MRKHILIVDDDEDDRDLFCKALTLVDQEAECLQAVSGLDALRLLKSGKIEKPDFIFLDLNMPRLSGKDCLKELKKDIYLSDIPVIIYTTSKLKDDKEETYKLGAVHFITKPSKLSELCHSISFVLTRDWHQVMH